MNIRAKIHPYEDVQRQALYKAMMAYLKACRKALKPSIEHSQRRRQEVEQSIITYKEQYKRDNPHLVGHGDYTRTGIILKAA